MHDRLQSDSTVARIVMRGEVDLKALATNVVKVQPGWAERRLRHRRWSNPVAGGALGCAQGVAEPLNQNFGFGLPRHRQLGRPKVEKQSSVSESCRDCPRLPAVSVARRRKIRQNEAQN